MQRHEQLPVHCPNRVERARLTAGAVIRDDGTIVYPDVERDARAEDAAARPAP